MVATGQAWEGKLGSASPATATSYLWGRKVRGGRELLGVFSPPWTHGSTSDFLYKFPKARRVPQALMTMAFSRVQDTRVKGFLRTRASAMHFWKGHGDGEQKGLTGGYCVEGHSADTRHIFTEIGKQRLHLHKPRDGNRSPQKGGVLGHSHRKEKSGFEPTSKDSKVPGSGFISSF